MSNTAIISLVISIVSFVLAVIYKIIDLTSSYAKLKNTVEHLQENMKVESKSNAETIRKITLDCNRQDNHLAKIDVTISQMAENVKTIDKKLDRLIMG